jgi:hypothetical protein
MKKWLIVVLLVICPVFLRAEKCEYNKHTEYAEFASHITYEYEYSMGEGKFTLKFYNVISGLYFKINKLTYEPDENDVVTISGISEGKALDIYVYGKDGCNAQVHNLNIVLPYYNPYYGTEVCKGYEQLTLCSSSFTPTKATKQMIEKTKETYDNVIIQDKDENETAEDKPSIVNKVWNFFVKYVLKVLLVLLSTGLSVLYYNNKLMKVEHGI